MDEQIQSKIQYLLQVAVRKNKVFIRASAANAANEAAKAMPNDSESIRILRDAIVKGPNAREQRNGCMELSAKYRAPSHANQKILTVLRKSLLDKELKVQVEGTYKFGENCRKDDLKYKIVLNGELVRNAEMTKWADKESPEAKICEEDEKKGFTVSDTCIEVANTQAAALNKWRLAFKWNKDLPRELKNVTQQVEDFVKYLYYPYVSHNYYPTPNENAPDRTIVAEFEHTPDTHFWKLIVRKPTSVLQLKDVRSGPVVHTLLPITATQTLPQNVFDYLAGNDSQRKSCECMLAVLETNKRPFFLLI